MSEVPNNRLFVGNLSNSTTDQDLQDAFKDAGAIKQSGIVTRGRLSLGYGFIDFVNAASVNDTIAKYKDLKIQDREVSFEVAKDASFQCEYSQVKKRERKPRAEGSDTQGTPFTGNNANANQGQGGQDGAEGDNVPQRRARPQRRRNRNRNTGGTGVPENDGQSLNNYRGQQQQGSFQGNQQQQQGNGFNNFGDAGQRPRNPRRRNNRQGDEQGNQSQGQSQGQQQPRPPREPRQPREPRPPREKIPSTTTLHVANLPYSFDDNNLGALFKEFNVVSSRVVIAKNGKPRGYGFVEFANESEQLRALNAKNNLSIPDGNETKTLTISISHTPANTTSTTTQ